LSNVNFIFISYISNYFINREIITQAGLYEDFISQKNGPASWEAMFHFAMLRMSALELCLASLTKTLRFSEISQV